MFRFGSTQDPALHCRVPHNHGDGMLQAARAARNSKHRAAEGNARLCPVHVVLCTGLHLSAGRS